MNDMLRVKASLVQMEGKEGVTPLMLASNKGHKEVRGGAWRQGVLMGTNELLRVLDHLTPMCSATNN